MKEGANLSDYISVQLGSSFLMNAGICGFIRFLRSNDAVEGEDYIIGDQELQINKDYILNNDIPEMYVDTFVRLFEEETKFLPFASMTTVPSLPSSFTPFTLVTVNSDSSIGFPSIRTTK